MMIFYELTIWIHVNVLFSEWQLENSARRNQEGSRRDGK